MKPDIRRTKIVATVGPASSSSGMIRQLIEAGVNVFRLNFSHGDHRSHEEVIDTIRRVSSERHLPVGILQDLGGPKIRLGVLSRDPLILPSGTYVHLFPGSVSNRDEFIPVQYHFLLEDISEGDPILMADGTIEMLVEKKEKESLIARIIVGGIIRSYKGVNLPSSNLRIKAFTDKDHDDLIFGLKKEVDFIALSFIRHEDDLNPVFDALKDQDYRPAVIAKIEKPQAVERLQQILQKVDGVMVARGDLGVEMPLERVPILQKAIIEAARLKAKPVITATQMLGSMTDNPRPTRAETSDVANAILDGTDAVMLSEETALGRYPIEAVKTMHRIAVETERHIQHLLRGETLRSSPGVSSGDNTDVNEAIGKSACTIAEELEAVAIVASTESGTTARIVSKFRPRAPIVAITHDAYTYRKLSLSWGVFPVLTPKFATTDEMFDLARKWAVSQGIARSGDVLVITAGVPVGIRGTTNLIKVLKVS
ncbi:pyruvate kinase [Thermodesulforhabdus norvegica]|uniref:Pyruvate kinase n=1 Tax=Thermodesulforhabdus norvegica TaxID=39841 RepID=A0A1I4VCS7_9BACT|nr:pyruvate kinase [Thermodesulforhabdus norvegica]SFM98900.1 pyruvate kinase [Thermodesulforhabdus norvegica]